MHLLKFFASLNRSQKLGLLLFAILLSALLPTVFISQYHQDIRQHAATSSGNNYYVSTSGSDSNPGTQTAPFATIKKASTLATPGTTVHVAPGTYTQAIATTTSGIATARITYISDVKWGAKIVPSSTTHAATGGGIWYNSGSYVDIVGFDMVGTGIGVYYGIRIQANYDRITGNHVHNVDNSDSVCNAGAGINTIGGLAQHDNYIIGNIVNDVGPYSGAFYCNLIHGIYFASGYNYAWNNIVYHNRTWGFTSWHATTNDIIMNNVVFGNGFINTSGGGIAIGSGEVNQVTTDLNDYSVVANNIVVYNPGGQSIRENGNTGIHNQYLNNLVYGNSGPVQLQNGLTTKGTVAKDPLFVNWQANGTGDYHLQPTSPAIDAGTSIAAPSTDFDGNARPLGAGFDIGAYEYMSAAAATPTTTPTFSPTPRPLVTLAPTLTLSPTPTPTLPYVTPTLFCLGSCSLTRTPSPVYTNMPSPSPSVPQTIPSQTVTVAPNMQPTTQLSPTPGSSKKSKHKKQSDGGLLQDTLKQLLELIAKLLELIRSLIK
jgi:Protein of unknown function (DUF1565)